MSGAQADLARLVAQHAAFHQGRLKHATEDPEPLEPVINAFVGLSCEWTPQADPAERIWHRCYGEGILPADLAAKIDYLDYAQRTVWLNDGSRIVETDTRLAAHGQTEATIRIMIAQARAKKWSGISVRGNEAFLRAAARLAFAEGVEIADNPRIVAEVQDARFAPEDPPKPETRNKFTNTQTRIWEKLYGTDHLPDDLSPKLQYVSAKKCWCKLKDGTFLRDTGERISVNRTSEDAFRLVIVTARAKGWSGLSIHGSHAFLRMAVQVAAEVEYPITGRTPDMQAVLENEWEQMEGECSAHEPENTREPKDKNEEFDMS